MLKKKEAMGVRGGRTEPSELLGQVQAIETAVRPMQSRYEERFAPNFCPLSHVKRETIWAAIIAYLMDPSEKHAQGRLFVDAFLGAIGVAPPTVRDPINVETEYHLSRPSSGRVDILLFLHPTLIAIEVKINAPDGKQQLKRYASGLKHEYDVNPILVYVGKSGRLPSKYSLADVSLKGCKILPLASEYIDELSLASVYRGTMPKIQAERVRGFVEVLVDQLELISNVNQRSLDPMTKVVQDHLQSSPERLHAAFVIQKALEPTQCELVGKFAKVLIKRIEEQMSAQIVWIDKSLESITKIPRKSSKMGYPSLTFKRKSSRSELCVRLECSRDGSWCGLYSPQPLGTEELERLRLHLCRKTVLGDDYDSPEPNWPWWTRLDDPLDDVFGEEGSVSLARILSSDHPEQAEAIGRVVKVLKAIDRAIPLIKVV